MKEFILMADVLGSSEKFPPKLMNNLRTLVEGVNRKLTDQITSPLTITLGDEFQGIVKNLDAGVQVIILTEELMMANEWDYKLRYVLSEGEVETEVNTKNAYEMLGTGLTMTREFLIDMKKEPERFLFVFENKILSKRLNDLFKLLQHFLDSWHPKDLSTVSGFLKGMDYKELAEVQNKDASSLWRRRKSLAIDEYQTCKALIMDTING